MGVNTISKILSDAKKRFNLGGNVSNHSVRKTGISCLLDSDIPELYDAQHSGMKSIDSLGSYKVVDKDNQNKMSNILNSSIEIDNKNNDKSRVASPGAFYGLNNMSIEDKR